MKLLKLLQHFSTKKCTILWPKVPPSNVYEEKYAQEFCLKRAKKLSDNIIFYDPQSGWENANNFEKSDVCIVFSDPYTYLSEIAFKLLANSCYKGTAILPVYTAPFPYVDPLSFEEAAYQMSSEGKLVQVSKPDLSCFACLKEDLKKIKKGNINFMVHTGALAHRFIEMFSSPREDLIKLIPESARIVLDVGCASGNLGKKLLELREHILIDGVEINPSLAKKAQKHYRKVFVGKFEEVELPKNFYDVVCMGDVLEHMYDPWQAINKARDILREKGILIGSVPNASHWSIVRQLIMGRFDYIPLGLLCISHIRFFTPDTLKESLQDAGFIVEKIELMPIPPSPSAVNLVEALCHMGASRDLLEGAEIFFVARKYKLT